MLLFIHLCCVHLRCRCSLVPLFFRSAKFWELWKKSKIISVCSSLGIKVNCCGWICATSFQSKFLAHHRTSLISASSTSLNLTCCFMMRQGNAFYLQINYMCLLFTINHLYRERIRKCLFAVKLHLILIEFISGRCLSLFKYSFRC